MALISLNSNIPRYFVQQRLGAGSLGIFAALSYLSLAGSTVINAAGLSVTPRLARLFNEAPGDFVRTLLTMSALAFVFGLAGVALLALAGQPILNMLYGAPYAAHLNVAILLMMAGAISCVASVVGFGLTAAHCFRPQLPLFAVVTVVAAAASFILIGRNGLVGAATGQIIAAFVQLLGGAALLTYTIRQTPVSVQRFTEVAA
jgi:O-antigen/teichoic acid export membrane protein